ncbi:MAG: type VI secretion system-associated protein TagF [Maricaulaceae bacterium]
MGRSDTGFYGKLPSRGDFVSRNIDAAFVDAWDPFVRAGLADARAALGEAFEPCYLDAPAWVAALGPGVCGPTARLLVMCPSVDAAGRYFPLTAVWPDPAAEAPPAVRLVLAADWAVETEAALRNALGPQSDPDALAERLAAIAPPYDPVGSPGAVIPLDWAEAGAQAACVAQGAHAGLTASIGLEVGRGGTLRSVWRAPRSNGRIVLGFGGAPPPTAWRAFLQPEIGP